MRHLWFGGSFNPIHLGHLICARAVAESAGYDRVILVPSGQPPHKSGDTTIANARHRLNMCRLAIAGDSFFDVDDMEMRRSGPSYTLDTALDLKARGFAEVSFLIGADMAISLPTWHEPARLMAEARLVLMARPGWAFDWASLPVEFRHLEKNIVPAPQLEISSTLIRNRLARGQSIRYLTSDAVIEYIRVHQLWQ